MKFGVDFDALLARASTSPTQSLTLAVSGGSDSLALLLLTHDWAMRTGRTLSILTVDHGLRPEARREAEAVAAWSRELGHKHQTLSWATPKPAQNAARTARFRLICDAMRAADAQLLLVGHTLDDVVETALIRRRRGVRGASIAGPTIAAPAPVWPEGRGITILRPLVKTRRADLQNHLRRDGRNWIDDPTNHSLAYERIRVRKFLHRHLGLRDISTQFVRELQQQRAIEDQSLGRVLDRVQVRSDGTIDTAGVDVTERALSLLARCASGSAAEPRAGSVRSLVSTLRDPGTRQTLGGAWFQKTQDGFHIGRDPGANPRGKERDMFDGRFARSEQARLPNAKDQGFLVRHASPPDQHWHEIISERLAHMAQCYKTPDLDVVSA
ncbi:MAG: tRNA lysidine(34) synthetase TilS [Hyphomonadaceae bacterium]|nr:tRNA lysidine(34) synthetase TilS [Hyphomonadaceae bacterium]